MLCKLVPRNKPTQAPPKRRCLSRCTMVSRRANPHQGLPSFSCLRLTGSSDFGACLVSELLIAKRKTLALKVAPPELAPGIHEGGFRTFPRFRKASCQARGKWCHASTSKPSPKRNIWSNEPVRRLLKGKTGASFVGTRPLELGIWDAHLLSFSMQFGRLVPQEMGSKLSCFAKHAGTMQGIS